MLRLRPTPHAKSARPQRWLPDSGRAGLACSILLALPALLPVSCVQRTTAAPASPKAFSTGSRHHQMGCGRADIFSAACPSARAELASWSACSGKLAKSVLNRRSTSSWYSPTLGWPSDTSGARAGAA